METRFPGTIECKAFQTFQIYTGISSNLQDFPVLGKYKQIS